VRAANLLCKLEHAWVVDLPGQKKTSGCLSAAVVLYDGANNDRMILLKKGRESVNMRIRLKIAIALIKEDDKHFTLNATNS
jgi:hypothetical protein